MLYAACYIVAIVARVTETETVYCMLYAACMLMPLMLLYTVHPGINLIYLKKKVKRLLTPYYMDRSMVNCSYGPYGPYGPWAMGPWAMSHESRTQSDKSTAFGKTVCYIISGPKTTPHTLGP